MPGNKYISGQTVRLLVWLQSYTDFSNKCEGKGNQRKKSVSSVWVYYG